MQDLKKELLKGMTEKELKETKEYLDWVHEHRHEIKKIQDEIDKLEL